MIETTYGLKHRDVYLEYESFAGKSRHRVYDTRAYEDHLILCYIKDMSAAFNLVVVLDGHDYLYRKMPVRRICLEVVILIEPDTACGRIVDGLVQPVKILYHDTPPFTNTKLLIIAHRF
jgi:hypothetical protein